MNATTGIEGSVEALALQPNGRILVAGSRNFEPEAEAFISATWPTATSTSFEGDGYIPINVEVSYAGFVANGDLMHITYR